jgi:hypothetical protein
VSTPDRRRTGNPLLPAAPPPPAREAPIESSAVLRDQVEARYGPQTPLNIPQQVGVGLPPWKVDTNPALWVVGVHGGAGATTITELLGPGADELSRHLPVVPTGAPAPRVLLVARTHASGLAAAQGAAAQWASGTTGVTLVGLVVVDDAPKLPKQLVAEIAALGGMVPALWHLPWCESWRTTTVPVEVPRRTRKSVEAITVAADKATTIPAPGLPTGPLRPPPPAHPEPARTTPWAARPAAD